MRYKDFKYYMDIYIWGKGYTSTNKICLHSHIKTKNSVMLKRVTKCTINQKCSMLLYFFFKNNKNAQTLEKNILLRTIKKMWI